MGDKFQINCTIDESKKENKKKRLEIKTVLRIHEKNELYLHWVVIPYGKFTSTFKSKFQYAYITDMNVITPFKPLWHFTLNW